jgi:hypothetical protein
MRATLSVLTMLTLAGCAFERAQIAEDARAQMVGMTKEQVLACMGPPASRMAEGQTEVCCYRSGNGHVEVATDAQAVGSMVMGGAVATARFCDVQVVMRGGRVAQINYAGPTGGLLTVGEQCAFVVRNCVRQRTVLAK